MRNTLLSTGKRKSFKTGLVWLSMTALVPFAELQAREGDDTQHFTKGTSANANEPSQTEQQANSQSSLEVESTVAATNEADQPAKVATTLVAANEAKAAQGATNRFEKAPETRSKQVEAVENKKAAEKKAREDEHREKIDNLSSYIETTYKVHPKKADTIVTEAVRKGNEIGLEPELILAIIAVESTFRARAVSHAGARGLMQIMPRYHRKKIRAVGGTRALFVPEKNIHVGTLILTEYLALSRGNLRRALLRYNGSLGKRSSYADKVLRKYQKFKRVA